MNSKQHQKEAEAIEAAYENMKVIKYVGRGSYGNVYFCVDQAVSEQVAVKIMDMTNISEEQRNQFDSEARMLKSLRNPFIVRYRDNTTSGQYYLIMMDYAETNLQEFVKNNLTFFKAHPQCALYVLKQMASGLNHMHSRATPIGWRDCKPENVLLAQDPQGPPDFKYIALLSDLGTAKCMNANATMSLGMTPLYKSPENVYNMPFTTASDIWSLGLVFRFMFTGEDPFSVDNLNQNITSRNFQGKFNDVAPEIIELFNMMTCEEPTERITAQQIIEHPLLASIPIDTDRGQSSIPQNSTLMDHVKNIKYGITGNKILELGISLGEYLISQCTDDNYVLRRIHPANINVQNASGNCTLIVSDQQDPAVLRGTPDDMAYLSDAVLNGKSSSSASVAWQLGCVMLHIACDKNTFLGESVKTTMDRISNLSPDLSTAGEFAKLCEFILGLMRTYVGLNEFVTALIECRRTGAQDGLFSQSNAENSDSKSDAERLFQDVDTAMIEFNNLMADAEEMAQAMSNATQSLLSERAAVLALLDQQCTQYTLPFNALDQSINASGDVTQTEQSKTEPSEVYTCTCGGICANLFQAAEKDCAACCKTYQSMVRQRDPQEYNRTSIMKAAVRGCASAVRFLIPFEKRPAARDKWTALMLAAQGGHVEVVKLLAPYQGGIKDREGKTALMEAAKWGRHEIINILIPYEKGLVGQDGWSALYWTTQGINNSTGHKECAEILWNVPEEREVLTPQLLQAVKERFELK